MTETHEPTPEFVSRLEWQVRSTLSRRDRFSMPTRRPTQQIMKMAALILISVFCGAAGVATADQIQESRTRAMLLQQIDLELQLTGAQLQMVRTRLADVEKLFETGLIDEETLKVTMNEVRMVELRYARFQLDREEISLTSCEPQQKVTASLVGGRDFVTERLDLDLAEASGILTLAETKSATLRRQVEKGLLSATSNTLRLWEVKVRETQQQVHYRKILHDLRARFLDGELTAEEAEYEARLAEAESNLDNLALEVARENLIRVEELFKQGAIRESEVYEAQLEVLRREVRMQHYMLMIENLRSALDDPPPM